MPACKIFVERLEIIWIAKLVLDIHKVFHRTKVYGDCGFRGFLSRVVCQGCAPYHDRYYASLLPSKRLAKRVELWRNARLNFPMGPLRCLAMMISARPFNSGSSCL